MAARRRHQPPGCMLLAMLLLAATARALPDVGHLVATFPLFPWQLGMLDPSQSLAVTAGTSGFLLRAQDYVDGQNVTLDMGYMQPVGRGERKVNKRRRRRRRGREKKEEEEKEEEKEERRGRRR